MALTETLTTDGPPPDAFEVAAAQAQRAVAQARRNPWFRDDLLAPELSTVLSAIVAPRPLRYGGSFAPGEAWRAHRNPWSAS